VQIGLGLVGGELVSRPKFEHGACGVLVTHWRRQLGWFGEVGAESVAVFCDYSDRRRSHVKGVIAIAIFHELLVAKTHFAHPCRIVCPIVLTPRCQACTAYAREVPTPSAQRKA
jgi:hypothetical protein